MQALPESELVSLGIGPSPLGGTSPIKLLGGPWKSSHEYLENVLGAYLRRAGYDCLFDVDKAVRAITPCSFIACSFKHLAAEDEALLAAGLMVLSWWIVDDALEEAPPDVSASILQSLEQLHAAALSQPPPDWLLQAPTFLLEPSEIPVPCDVIAGMPFSPSTAGAPGKAELGGEEFATLLLRLTAEGLAAVHACSLSSTVGQGLAPYHSSWWGRLVQDIMFYQEAMPFERQLINLRKTITIKVFIHCGLPSRQS
jgi:hypothetical protein